MDTKANRCKKHFLDLLLSTDLRVLNGRILGDLSGSFTCFEWNGRSQIDYFLATQDIFPLFNYLKVEQKTEYSDHCLVSCSLNLYRILEPPNSSTYLPLPAQYIWNNNPSHLKIIMNLGNIKSLMNDFLVKPAEQLNRYSVDNATKDVASIINTVMNTCLQTRWKGKTRKPRFHSKKFFDQECKEAKRLMRKYSSLLSKHPFNKEFNTQYFYYLKKYKRTLRKKKHDYENKLISQLESIANRDPKKYWQFVDTLKESVKKNVNPSIAYLMMNRITILGIF